MDGLCKAEELLRRHGKEAIWAHSKAVAEVTKAIAAQYGLDASVCRRAAYCHDVGGIVKPDEMIRIAREWEMPLDPAEVAHPFLLHQRFSERICREELGIVEERILCAVGCHTTLKANAAKYDMAVFLADKLAWDQPGEPPYRQVVEDALSLSLERACLAYIDYTMENGMILMPHGWLLEARAWLIPFASFS